METNERILKKIKTVYTEIVRRLIDPSFTFPGGGQPAKQLSIFVEQFTKMCGGELNYDRIVDYCIFQCHKNRTFPHQRGLAPKTFGKTAMNKYRTMASKEKRFMEDKWLAEASLNREYLVRLIVEKEHPMAKYIYMPAEEATKMRGLNTDVGFVICLASTLMWSPFSDTCSVCRHSDKCKKETECRFPELYRLRIERWQKNKIEMS